MRHTLTVAAMALFGFGAVLSGCAPTDSGVGKMTETEKRAQDPRNKNFRAGDKASGYVYMTSQTRDIQDDDFANPAFTWVDLGEEIWNKKQGSTKNSCASCHGDAKSMKGVANKFPKYDAKRKRMISLQVKVNDELTKRMGAKKWKWESTNMLGMAAYIRLQSRGMPVTADISGVAKPFFEKGKKFFNQRRGLLDMACKHCHVDNAGNMARSNVLSEAQMNGFPTYRFKWQKPGSLHRRFIGCNKNIRAKPYKRGSEEYTNLELYMAWRSSGLKWETPAVRN